MHIIIYIYMQLSYHVYIHIVHCSDFSGRRTNQRKSPGLTLALHRFRVSSEFMVEPKQKRGKLLGVTLWL